MDKLTVAIRVERWPIAGTFRISRGQKTEALVVVVEVTDGTFTGRGECVPYARYGETVDSVVSAIEVAGHDLSRQTLQHAMPSGAARNAVDCALWDMEAKRAGRRAYELMGLAAPKPLVVPYTISLDAPEKMAEVAALLSTRPILKIKLGAEGDAERLKAVRSAAPKARLIVDANEGWTPQDLAPNLAACQAYGVECVEQPLPASNDAVLGSFAHTIPICADESVFDRESLPGLVGKYDGVNIKLDKAGGLTEALAVMERASQLGFEIMVGCMVSTSLSMAPAFLIAQKAKIADLDGGLLLAEDRPEGLVYKDGLLHPPTSALWG